MEKLSAKLSLFSSTAGEQLVGCGPIIKTESHEPMESLMMLGTQGELCIFVRKEVPFHHAQSVQADHDLYSVISIKSVGVHDSCTLRPLTDGTERIETSPRGMTASISNRTISKSHSRIITVHPVTCLAFYDVSSSSAEAGTTYPCDTTCCK
jgi:hypothetical protein